MTTLRAMDSTALGAESFRITSLASCGGCAAKVAAGELRHIMDLAAGFTRRRVARDRLLVGTETGDDAAVFALDQRRTLVLTTDFVTPTCDDPYLYGQIAAANALSDVFAMGGVPVVALAVCMFPEALPHELAAAICAGGADKAAEAGAIVAGGHTVRNGELFFGLAVTGEVPRDRFVRNVGARPGDRLVLTKPLGTGTAINAYRSGRLSEAKLRRVCEGMATLNAVAGGLLHDYGVHAATDVTGFGLAGHALGMARGSAVGLRVWLDQLPAYDDVLDLLEAGVTSGGMRNNQHSFEPDLGVNCGRGPIPARLRLVFDPQTSGGLLVALPRERAGDLVDALRSAGVAAATIIGEVVAANEQAPALDLLPTGSSAS
jgi:selenide,water dikinase